MVVLHRSNMWFHTEGLNMKTLNLNTPQQTVRNVWAAWRQIWTELSKSHEQRQHERQQAYLNEAVDRYDLEYRMRHLDQSSATHLN